jgi:hypothetical protein
MPSKQLNLPPVEVKPVSREPVGPGKELSLVGLLADSVASSGCSEKEAAICQGYEPAYWSRIKTGEKAAHLDRVSRLPERVQREFVKRYALALKLHVTDEDTRKRVILDLARAAINALEQIA